eukprot:3349839-Alexandrium_andersonii.AAC.1
MPQSRIGTFTLQKKGARGAIHTVLVLPWASIRDLPCRTHNVASSIRSLNFTDPRTTLEFVPTHPRG